MYTKFPNLGPTGPVSLAFSYNHLTVNEIQIPKSCLWGEVLLDYRTLTVYNSTSKFLLGIK